MLAPKPHIRKSRSFNQSNWERLFGRGTQVAAVGSHASPAVPWAVLESVARPIAPAYAGRYPGEGAAYDGREEVAEEDGSP